MGDRADAIATRSAAPAARGIPVPECAARLYALYVIHSGGPMPMPLCQGSRRSQGVDDPMQPIHALQYEVARYVHQGCNREEDQTYLDKRREVQVGRDLVEFVGY